MSNTYTLNASARPLLTASQMQALATGRIANADGGVFSLSEVAPVQTLTATATAQTGAGFFRGLSVRAAVGFPQTVTVYDATSATGTPIATFTVNALGSFFWDGNWTTPGNGVGARRPITTGLHLVISGGTSRTIDAMVEPS